MPAMCLTFAPFTKGTKSFWVVNRPGRGTDPPLTPTPYSAEVGERVNLYFSSPTRSSRPILGRILTLVKCNNLDNLEVFVSFTVLLFIIVLLLTESLPLQAIFFLVLKFLFHICM